MIEAVKQNCQFEDWLLHQNQEEGRWRGRPQISLPYVNYNSENKGTWELLNTTHIHY